MKTAEQMGNDLPIELEVEILSWLPVKSLVRFTSVCKSWYALIKSPNFTTSHLNRSNSNDYNCHVIIRGWFCSVIVYGKTTVDLAKIDIPLCNLPLSETQLVGSCNGLLCLTNISVYDLSDSCVYLWNPSVRKSKTIVSSCFMDLLSNSSHVILGFGFHKPTNDYKVVRIAYGTPSTFPPEAEVYSLITDSWSRVKATVPCFAFAEIGTFCDGAIHWMGTRIDNFANPAIMSFDLNDEVFRVIMLPTNLSHRDVLFMPLVEMKGSLALFVIYPFENQQSRHHCDIWVMREYGVMDSWTKLTIVLLEKIWWPLGCTKNGKNILFLCDQGVVVSFDLGNLQSEVVEVDGAYPYKVAVGFQESLVVPEAGNAMLGHVLEMPREKERAEVRLEACSRQIQYLTDFEGFKFRVRRHRWAWAR